MRIDDLARQGATTVRNVRAYQDRGLLPPPRREGRVGFYGPQHLARLRLISALLERGYTLANIGELVAAWEQGQDLGHLLGFETALMTSWNEEAGAYFSGDELAEMFPTLDAEALAAAEKMDLLVRSGDGFVSSRPETVRGAAELVRGGVPLDAVLDLGGRLATAADDIARGFVGVVVDHIVEPRPVPLAGADLDAVAGIVERLRPLARAAVVAEVGYAMERLIAAELTNRLARTAPADTATPAGEAD
jgi:DNA-binding transcriptional MerR regulator